MAPDDPPTREDHDTTSLPVVLDSIEQPLMNSRCIPPVTTMSSAASASHNFTAPPASTRGYFSTLAPDPSDEIGEFEETTGKKRKNGQAAECPKAKRTVCCCHLIPARASGSTAIIETNSAFRDSIQYGIRVDEGSLIVVLAGSRPDACGLQTTYASKCKRKRR